MGRAQLGQDWEIIGNEGGDLVFRNRDTGDERRIDKNAATSFASITFDDSGSDPTTNGEIRLNGSVLKAKSGGAVKDIITDDHSELSGINEGSHHPRGGFLAPGILSSTSFTASTWSSLRVDTSAAGGNVTITCPATSNSSGGDEFRVTVIDSTNDTTIQSNSNNTLLNSARTIATNSSVTFEFDANNDTWAAVATS